MAADGEELSRWIFGPDDARRYTQDSPVLPDVWLAYAEDPGERPHLLLTPHAESTAAALAAALRERLADDLEAVELAYSESYVVASLTFDQLIRDLLPLSDWWSTRLWAEGERDPDQFAWLVGVVRFIAGPDSDKLLRQLAPDRPEGQAPLWSVNLDRQARTALWRSREAIKADAATRLFDVSCRRLRWAIIDSGIDATHPAFGRRDDDGALIAGTTRVVATYDFTRLRGILAGRAGDEADEVGQRLKSGRAIDWDTLAPLLAIPNDGSYAAPVNEHGTHVAGIVGGDWRATDEDMPVENDLVGICPDIELYDLRVLGDDGTGSEFAITAALQFVRHLNSHSDLQVIHGVNLSLSLDHDVRNYAVGRTPVCDECERLVSSGVVVVSVAGNQARAEFSTAAGPTEGYRTVTITDPGNAERVITVGATHRFQPHTYGVSYFSSRGPTGDGRAKPDLVAPGEKINSPVPGSDYKTKDGTSQAAPHVSGAAALLMARYEELLGHPERVKQILCATATDLGRERYFQGAGMVDALRAMQSV